MISKIYYIFKRKLENQLLHSIAIKDAAIITSRGSGAFLGSIFVDSEQISSSLAVNYFAILLDFLSSIISIIIGGLWNLSFALIVSVALLVMFAVIVIANNISIRNFKKGKEMIYQINPRILEMIENRDTIMSNASFSKYQEKEVSDMYERDKYFQKSNNASSFSSVLLKAIPFISLSVFFLFSISSIKNGEISSGTIVGLVSYFTFIFSPISSIKEIFENIKKLHAFYSREEETLKSKDFFSCRQAVNML